MKYIHNLLWFISALSQRMFSRTTSLSVMKVILVLCWIYIGASVQSLFMSPPVHTPKYPLGAELDHYVAAYEELLETDVSHIDIVWVDKLPGTSVGVCYYFPITATRVVAYRIALRKDTWLYLSPLQRASLVFHELGHCHMSMDHDTRVRPDGCPLSLMYPSVIDDQCLGKHWSEYLSRLALYHNARRKR